MRSLAEQVPRLIHVSLLLFFLGLGDSMLHTNTPVGVTTVVLICICGSFYLYSISGHLWNLQSPYQTLISRPIFSLMQRVSRSSIHPHFRRNRHGHTTIGADQEELLMEESEERKDRDVRAIQWLVDITMVNAEMEPLLLAIPGTCNTEWGRAVWKDVSSQGRSDPNTLKSLTDHSTSHVSPSQMYTRTLEGTAVDTICRCVRYLFESCNNRSYFQNEEARRRRMHACVEASASLVYCTDFRLEWFGEVSKLVSETGDIEKINQWPTIPFDPSFAVRWTCLSLVAVQQILSRKELRLLASYAMRALTNLEYGQRDKAGWRSAQKIEKCLKTGWERVEELRQAFEPLTQKTKEEVEEVLRNHEQHISALERVTVEAHGVEDVDRRISSHQDAMDDATYGLTRQLPGVSFDQLRGPESFLICNSFNSPATGSASVIPQFVFPGQALARFGLKLREVLDGQAADGHEEILESLKSIDQVPISLRRPDGLMKRQLWRLQDLRDGGGLGYTVELFFLSLRQLLSIHSLHESNSAFYVGAFKIITSHWEDGKESLGTQHILLGIICNLIIGDPQSEFSYPESITTLLLEMVRAYSWC